MTRCRSRAGKLAYIIAGMCKYLHRHLQIRAWADAYICVVGIEKFPNGAENKSCPIGKQMHPSVFHNMQYICGALDAESVCMQFYRGI